MIFCVKEFFLQKEISEKYIHFELFTTSGQKTQGTRQKVQAAEGSGPKSNITVKVDGRSFDFSLSLNSDVTILDAALQQGADLPYACKGGMCCTAKQSCWKEKWKWMYTGDWNMKKLKKDLFLPVNLIPKLRKW